MIQERDPSAAVYAYGSVVTGQARVGVSDVDLLTIGLASSDRTTLYRNPELRSVIDEHRHPAESAPARIVGRSAVSQGDRRPDGCGPLPLYLVGPL